MLNDYKKQDEQEWKTELLRINDKLSLMGGWIAVLTYCGGSTIGFVLGNTRYTQVGELWIVWLIWLPACCIGVAYLFRAFYKISPVVFGFTILWSMSFSAALGASWVLSPLDFLYMSFSFFPIFMAFSLLSVWHWRLGALGALGSVLMAWAGFALFYHNPEMALWVRTWVFILPVAIGGVVIMDFRYRTIRKTFFITRALQRSKEELEKKNEDITASIAYAQRIQSAILPAQTTIDKHINEFFLFFRPRDVVSGDFYFFAPIEKGYIAMAVDCTGHGVPGAFMSMIGNEILNEIINQRHITEPSQILFDLNIAIRLSLRQDETDNRDGMDLVLVKVLPAEREITFAGVKNNLYIMQAGKVEVIKGSKTAIGGEQREQARTFEQHTQTLQEGAMLYLTTDGYLDQFGGTTRKKFGTARFKELLTNMGSLPAEAQQKAVSQTFFNWLQTGQEMQIDDVLVWGIRV